MFAPEDAGSGDVLAYLTDYTVKVYVNGETLQYTFNRPAYLDSDDNARVTAVDAEEREITVSYTYVDSANVVRTPSKKLEVPEGIEINFQEALGQEIQVWYNGEDEVVKYAYETEEIVYDAIEFTDVDELETIDEEAEYDLAENVKLIVNYGSPTEEEYNGYTGTDAIEDAASEYDYAKLIFNEDGDVEYIYAYTFPTAPILVEKVDGNVIVGYDESELNLKDYIIVKDGKQIAIEDIQAGDLLFFNKDANKEDGYAVVYNSNVKGEIEEVFQDSFDVDGVNYDYTNDYGDVLYLDADGDFTKIDEDAVKQLQDGGEVTLYTNFKGELIYVTGAVDEIATTSNGLYLQGEPLPYLNAKGDGQLEIEGVDAEGEVALYDFAIDSLDQITVFKTGSNGKAEKVEFEKDEPFPGTPSVDVDKFVLAEADGSAPATKEDIAAIYAVNGTVKEKVLDLSAFLGNIGTNNVINVLEDTDGNVVELQFFESAYETITDANKFDEEDKYAAGYLLEDSTLVYDLSDVLAEDLADPDEDDVVVTTWGELKEAGVEIDDAIVYYDEDGYVTHIVSYGDVVADDTEHIAVIQDVAESDNKVVRIKALVNGEEVTLNVDKEDVNIEAGDIVEISLNSAGDLVTKIDTAISSRLVAGTVKSVSTSKNQIVFDVAGDPDGVTYELNKDAEVYKATAADSDDYSVKALYDVEVGNKVVLVLPTAGSYFADAAVIVSSTAGYNPVVVDTLPIVEEVSDGDVVNTDVTVTLEEGETATLDGAPYTGTAITAEGDYTLVVTNAEGSTTVNFTIDKTAPTVTPAGDDAGNDEAVTDAALTITFSEALSEASQDAVEGAITAANTTAGTLAYAWDGAELTVTATGTATFTADVTVDITDLAGNTTEDAVVIAE